MGPKTALSMLAGALLGALLCGLCAAHSSLNTKHGCLQVWCSELTEVMRSPLVCSPTMCIGYAMLQVI